MKNFSKLPLLLLLLVLPAPAYSLDADGDGFDDIYIYYPDTQRVEAYNSTGKSIVSFPLPPQLIGKTPLVFPGLVNSAPVLFSISSGGAESVLYSISSDENVSTQLVGDISKSAIILFDLDGNRSSDLVTVNKLGTIRARYNVFNESERTVIKQIPRLKRRSHLTLSLYDGEPFLFIYTPARKKRKTLFQGYSLSTNKETAFVLKKRIKAQLFPYNLKESTAGELVGIESTKSGNIKRVENISLAPHAANTIALPKSRILIPGTYQEFSTARQLFSVHDSGLFLANSGTELNIVSALDLTEATNRSGAIISQPFFPYLRKKGPDRAELCTHTEDGSDGPAGFLLKASDKDGTLVVLLPIQINTAYVELLTKQGKFIERLRYSGRSNGYRETHRAAHIPTSYPKELIVRAVIGSALTTCYQISNSHVRND